MYHGRRIEPVHQNHYRIFEQRIVCKEQQVICILYIERIRYVDNHFFHYDVSNKKHGYCLL